MAVKSDKPIHHSYGEEFASPKKKALIVVALLLISSIATIWSFTSIPALRSLVFDDDSGATGNDTGDLNVTDDNSTVDDTNSTDDGTNGTLPGTANGIMNGSATIIFRLISSGSTYQHFQVSINGVLSLDYTMTGDTYLPKCDSVYITLQHNWTFTSNSTRNLSLALEYERNDNGFTSDDGILTIQDGGSYHIYIECSMYMSYEEYMWSRSNDFSGNAPGWTPP